MASLTLTLNPNPDPNPNPNPNSNPNQATQLPSDAFGREAPEGSEAFRFQVGTLSTPRK